MSMYLHKHCLKRYPVKHFHHDNHAFVTSTKNSNNFKSSNLSEWLYVISSKLQLADNPSTPVSELYGGRFVPGSPETLCLCWFCIQINYQQQNYDSTSWRLRGEYTERQQQRQASDWIHSIHGDAWKSIPPPIFKHQESVTMYFNGFNLTLDAAARCVHTLRARLHQASASTLQQLCDNALIFKHLHRFQWEQNH